MSCISTLTISRIEAGKKKGRSGPLFWVPKRGGYLVLRKSIEAQALTIIEVYINNRKHSIIYPVMNCHVNPYFVFPI